jgi:hypothetical protein
MAMAMAFKATTVTATRYPAKYHVAVAETLNKECNSDRGPKKQQCPTQPTVWYREVPLSGDCRAPLQG